MKKRAPGGIKPATIKKKVISNLVKFQEIKYRY